MELIFLNGKYIKIYTDMYKLIYSIHNFAELKY